MLYLLKRDGRRSVSHPCCAPNRRTAARRGRSGHLFARGSRSSSPVPRTSKPVLEGDGVPTFLNVFVDGDDIRLLERPGDRPCRPGVEDPPPSCGRRRITVTFRHRRRVNGDRAMVLVPARGGRATPCRSRRGPGCRTPGSPTCRARRRRGPPSRRARLDADAPQLVHHARARRTSREREHADGDEAERLHAELVEASRCRRGRPCPSRVLREHGDGEEPGRERAPDAGHAVYGDRADRVVDADAARRRSRRRPRSRRTTRPITIAAHGATKPDAAVIATSAPSAPFSIIEMSGLPSTATRRDAVERAGRGREVRGRRDVGEEAEAAEVDRERRAGVEAEPAEPEDQRAEHGVRDVVARDRVRAAVGAELADARAEDATRPRARRARPGSARPSSRRSPACPCLNSQPCGDQIQCETTE